MNKQTEALKMAIEALEMHVPHYIKDRGCDALIACKEALEQPAQDDTEFWEKLQSEVDENGY